MNVNRMKLAAAAIAVALALVLALVPQQSFRELSGCRDASAKAVPVSFVEPVELARWIVEGTKSLRLVDLREPWEFDDYSIKGSVNVAVDDVVSGKTPLEKGKTVVLLSRDGAEAAALWAVLAKPGSPAFVLRGGVAAWWDEVMRPVSLRAGAAKERAAEMKAIREWFAAGGAKPPAGAVKAPASMPQAPAAAPPPAAEPPPPAAPPAARKGGC